MAGTVRLQRSAGGALLRVELVEARGNVIDRPMVAALAEAGQAATEPSVRGVLLVGAGSDFSFGASIEDHLPERIGSFLREFHQLARQWAASPVPVLAAVRGRCLGGGLELAALAHRIWASPDARLGQPEIRLGVFAPVASVVLPGRVPRGALEEMLLSGRALGADEAHSIGLVDELADDPEAAARAWFEKRILPASRSATEYALRAARGGWLKRLDAELAVVERLYLDDLMATPDAVEGVRAFLDKRPPRWEGGLDGP